MRWRRFGVALLTALAVSSLCLATTAAAQEPQPEGRAWTLIDARTGTVLESHAAAQALPIASTTKLMTAYVAMRELPLDKIVRAAPYHPIYGESLLGLRTGQRISVRDLLYGLILRSGNDAAHDLALAAAGSVPRFVTQMNRRAAALGLADTHYANPVGLDQHGNYSSARDLATLTQHLLRIPAFARIADSRSATLRSLRPPRRIATINELLLDAPWITGVKTGHTFDAAYCLVGSGRRKGVDLISVALGAPSDEARFRDNLELLEYGFSQYRRRLPIRAGRDLADPSIRYSGGALPLRAAETVAVGLRRGQRLSVDVRAPSEVEGPIERGAVLGRATVTVDGRRAASVPLHAGRAIPAASAFDRARALLDNNLIAIAIVLFVILIGGVLLYRRLSGRNDQGERIRVKAQ
ncbi:MAG TPA: D-alanyl-D-alanine carboxypeptidase family protein [Solirubrobacterales bacterium]|jgi:D-alanyl-D-alanine carboxypeptidase|nr:D-alanyl-D-alanine carboxypeptidase family protein [Solirubrobacterales bacterium]